MPATTGLAARFYESLSPALRPEAASMGFDPFKPAFDAGPSTAERARDAAVSFVDALREGERTATLGLAGQADPQSVVTALASSEIAVQTAVTLRDKVVEAYQEILRMPV